jgi:predicted DsbA family dithiol-disulfide isomerase
VHRSSIANVTAIDVVEFTDPGCSWAWGTEPKLRLLRWRFGERLQWRRVLGGLIGDMNNYVENFDPVRNARRQSGYWRSVYEHTGMTYPANLEWMYTSTEPPGRAVKAAELQSDVAGASVLRRLRESIFVLGRPADTNERILEAVRGVEGLDEDRFAADLRTEVVEKAFREDWEETRRPNEYVMTLEGETPGIGRAKNTEGHWRFVFPTLIFRGPGGEATVPGWCAYERYEEAMETVAPGSTAKPRPDLSAAEVFSTWPTASQKELEVLSGTSKPPDGVVTYDWGEGSFFFTASEAASRGIG